MKSSLKQLFEDPIQWDVAVLCELGLVHSPSSGATFKFLPDFSNLSHHLRKIYEAFANMLEVVCLLLDEIHFDLNRFSKMAQMRID